MQECLCTPSGWRSADFALRRDHLLQVAYPPLPSVCARSTWTSRPCPSSPVCRYAGRDGRRWPERRPISPARPTAACPVGGASADFATGRRASGSRSASTRLGQQHVHLDRLDDHVAGQRPRAEAADRPPFADERPPPIRVQPGRGQWTALLELAAGAPRLLAQLIEHRARPRWSVCAPTCGPGRDALATAPCRSRVSVVTNLPGHPARDLRRGSRASPASGRCATSRLTTAHRDSTSARAGPAAHRAELWTFRPRRARIGLGRAHAGRRRSRIPRRAAGLRATVDEIVRVRPGGANSPTSGTTSAIESSTRVGRYGNRSTPRPWSSRSAPGSSAARPRCRRPRRCPSGRRPSPCDSECASMAFSAERIISGLGLPTK